MRAAGSDLPAVRTLGIRRLTVDSRAVKTGDTFVAYPGESRDGRDYIAEAIANGAASVLWDADGYAWNCRWRVPNLGIAHLRRKAGVIAPNGRLSSEPPILRDRLGIDRHGSRRLLLTENGRLGLTQWDIRELQKAKGAVRAAVDILMSRLGLQPHDLERMILTGSFGAQVDLEAVTGIGMIPPVRPEVIETVANGAGFGAAMFLTEEGFAIGEAIADKAEQIDLDQDVDFIPHYVGAMQLSPEKYYPIAHR